MVHHMEMTGFKPYDLSSILKTPRCKERTHSRKLASDFHMCAMAHESPPKNKYRVGPVANNTSCSCRGAGFGAQHPLTVHNLLWLHLQRTLQVLHTHDAQTYEIK